jgi:hypothetical protein
MGDGEGRGAVKSTGDTDEVVVLPSPPSRAVVGVAPGDGHGHLVRGHRGRFIVVIALLGVFLLFTNTGRGLIAPTVERLRLAAPSVFGDGGYTFSNTSGGQPVTFSSCRPVRVVINDTLRPKGAYGLVEQAVAEASRASGLTLTIVGSTDEAPDPNRALEQGRYGLGWAPVLISWTTPDVIPELKGLPDARGGPRGITETSTGRTYYVTGQVYLDTPALEDLLRQGRTDEVRATVMHELGHVLGLGHVVSPYELMSGHNFGLTRYGPGDLAGLARLGHGPCI